MYQNSIKARAENNIERVASKISGKKRKSSKNSVIKRIITNGDIVKLKNDCQKFGTGQFVVHNIANDEYKAKVIFTIANSMVPTTLTLFIFRNVFILIILYHINKYLIMSLMILTHIVSMTKTPVELLIVRHGIDLIHKEPEPLP